MSQLPEVVLTAPAISRTLRRLATEIADDIGDGPELVLVGIRSGGVPLAKRLADLMEELEGVRPEVGAVDITLYRDDLYTGLEKPVLGATEIDVDITGKAILLVDDVLFTGRTVRAALAELMDLGRPRFVRLVVLIDRGDRELPIQADYVGRELSVEQTDRVLVEVSAAPGGNDRVLVETREEM